MDIDKFENLINKADLVLRPRALIVNPSDKQMIIEAMPNIEREFKIYESELIEKGEALIMNRQEIEGRL